MEDGYQGRREGGGQRKRERQAGHREPGLTHPISGTHADTQKRTARCTRDLALHCSACGSLDWVPWGLHEPQLPPGLTGSLTALHAVLHQVPVDATCPDPVWGPPLKGGGGVCHVLHHQVLGFTCGCCKDPGKKEVGNQ